MKILNTKTIYDDGQVYNKLGMGPGTGEEVKFYAALAPHGASILELACGTGRLTIPLAKLGLNITGIDTSQSMLTAAEAKSAQEEVSPTFVEADMRTFSLGKRFDLVFLPNNSLAHLHSLTDIRSCFACVLEHLSEDGYFVVDMFNPSLPLLMREEGRHYAVAEYLRSDGRAVIVTETVAYDAATQINHMLWHYQTEGEPIDIRSLEMRIFFPQELDALLSLSGFKIVAKYGGFDQSVFFSGSRQQLLVCRKAISLTTSEEAGS